MDLAQPSDRFLSLLERGSCDGRGQKRCRSWMVLCSLLLVLAVLFGIAFLGGYFVGKTNGNCNDESQLPTRAFLVRQDGTHRIIPAFNGSMPVEDFIQCRYALVNGQLVCSPGNPLLTPKATTQIFIYQHMDDVSLILTVTGRQYGEYAESDPQHYNGQLTVNLQGIEGTIVEMKDVYHRQYGTAQSPYELKMELKWGHLESYGIIFRLANSSSLDGNISFSDVTGDSSYFNVRGGYMHNTMAETPPSPDLPLIIQSYKGKLPNRPQGVPRSVASLSQLGNIQLVTLTRGRRVSRSLSTNHLQEAIGFALLDSGTKALRYSVEIEPMVEHGGSNGSTCWHVMNNMDKTEVHTCLYMHDYLYNGLQSDAKPTDYALDRVLVDTFYRLQSEDQWKQLTTLVYEQSLNKLQTSQDSTRFIESQQIRRKLHHIGIRQGKQEDYRFYHRSVTTAMESVVQEVERVSRTTAQHSSLSLCNVSETLTKAHACSSHIHSCASGILTTTTEAEMSLSVKPIGLKCVDAIKSCSHLYNDCRESQGLRSRRYHDYQYNRDSNDNHWGCDQYWNGAHGDYEDNLYNYDKYNYDSYHYDAN